MNYIVISSINNLLAFSSVYCLVTVVSSIWLGFPGCKFLNVPGGKHSQQACDLALPFRESKEAKRLPSFHQKSRKKALAPRASLRCSTFISSLWKPLKIFVFKEWWYFKERTEWFNRNKLHYKRKALSLPSVTIINKANKPQRTCNLFKWTPASVDKAEQSQGWDSAVKEDACKATRAPADK